jgi:hypothetical protein
MLSLAQNAIVISTWISVRQVSLSMSEHCKTVAVVLTLLFVHVSYTLLTDLEALPFLRHICLLQVLRILVTELEMTVLYGLFDPCLAAQSNNRAYTLLDTPSCSNASHADVVLPRSLFHALDDLLVDSVFPLVDERIEELVALCAA